MGKMMIERRILKVFHGLSHHFQGPNPPKTMPYLASSSEAGGVLPVLGIRKGSRNIS
jgi:hypothetical protein